MNAREIRQLRKKFILISMLSIFLAMLFIGVTVNLITHIITKNAVYSTLDTLIAGAEEENFEYSYSYSGSASSGSSTGNNSQRISISEIISPKYSRNHYYVFRNVSGELLLLFTNAHDDDELSYMADLARQISSGSRSQGEYGDFYYKTEKQDDGSTVMAILEGSVIISTELRTLYATLIICLVGLIITFFLVRHFSEAAIRPEIENSMRQKEFITNASHELKTPLAVIRANTEMTEILSGESEWTQSTLHQVDHLNGLIQNLVMIARSQEKEDRSELSEIDASRAVNESVDPYELMASQSGRIIVRDIEDDVRIYADESRIRQLAALLIDNAMKYCDEGGTIGVSLKHTKSARSAKGRKGIRLVVSNDYAEGSSVDCSRFFDRFYREDASHNIDNGGYGIGLSIAESICRQYDGEIKAEWKDGVISFICDLSAQER